MAKKLIDDGGAKVKAELLSNTRYYNSAKASAENIVKNLVKSFNPDVENLQVDVEFYE
jgi:hypothetical protein